MEYSLSFLFLLFITYSFGGWLFETLFCSFQLKRWVDRGFLIGPICPIYGIAALAIIYLLKGYENDPLVLFVLSTVLATIIEYVTSYLLEKLFKVRWWDYSHLPFNFNGRIVLLNSLLFGVLGLLLLYVFNPIYVDYLSSIPSNYIDTIALIVLIIFTVDLTLTSNVLFKIRKNNKVLFKDQSEEISASVKRYVNDQVLLTKRLLNAFPNLQPIPKEKLIDKIKNYIKK